MMSCPVRKEVQTGDLLAWSQSPSGADSIWIKLVRFLTASEYGHVSVAFRDGDNLYHVEAVIPKIRVGLVPDDKAFYLIPLSKSLETIGKEPDMLFLNDKVGKKYGILDAIRAYFGLVTKKDDRWQCAELAHEFYAVNGLHLNPAKMTPSKLVASALLLEDLHLAKPCS